MIQTKGVTLKSLLRQSRRSYKGFTLIELMVVIVIIAILATIGAVMYSSTQKAVRMSKRIQDMKAIQLALETYKLSNGNYPITTPDVPGTWYSQCAHWVQVANANLVIPGLVPNFMAVIPADPILNVSSNQNCYVYKGSTTITGSYSQDYKLLVYNVPEISVTDMQQQPLYWDPVHPQNPQNNSCPYSDVKRTFTIYTTNARCW